MTTRSRCKWAKRAVDGRAHQVLSKLPGVAKEGSCSRRIPRQVSLRHHIACISRSFCLEVQLATRTRIGKRYYDSSSREYELQRA